ncbi:MAG TPA: copper resistance CopC family protein [bacterium]|nr:copper resistance CopC family protein [bacterium]
MRKVRRTVGWLGLGILICLGPVLPVWAHANLVRSSPAADAVLTGSPPLIQAWFSEEVAVKGSVMRLYDGADKVLAAGGVDLKDTDHESMRITPPRLAPGAYQVRWHAISADDNHVTEDVFRFSIRPASRGPYGPTAAFFSLLPVRLW